MVQSYSTDRMPGGLKGALAVVWLQAVVNLVFAVVLFHENRNNIDHGYTDDSGLLVTGACVTLGTALLLAAGALGAAARHDWARRTVIALEVLNILGGVLLVLLGGTVSGLLGMLVSAVVIAGFGSTKAVAWVRRR
ncbi:hypothetical protein [Kitasatospora azatica]|uniref:hypothetical protein n=1 Tax=Kitasatospora azatica TaxID=58347 RepID=UPI00055A1669|nr:hypothetical protein [Kitasatospora azatica]